MDKDFEIRIDQAGLGDWDWRIEIDRSGRNSYSFRLRNDEEMEALANKIDDALAKSDTEKDPEWAEKFANRLRGILAASMSFAELEQVASRYGYILKR